ncbi:UvrD-helicase domain-containing protein [Salinisphaera sp. P385]|uniref:DNA 3'-5' helicase n=1 Tax=Spectribacter acetivorans TaxID=3075603 RepID=A0ABU3B882_9GAMM|nr:UvrD-helicase domain-containing protein [Salinisphaera sp. P385]MDT0618683.1 UvrD-helicase domain-containing protein [Salinisphaera sp. P385]
MTADAAERARAIDPTRSLIVQAPAGSGKTALLIQRFLALLTTVEEPEEVVALTFTRKAAGEMRQRLIGAMESADGPEPAAEHDRRTQALARAAARHSDERGWDLAAYPGRLRIQTLDALCAGITRQMPMLSAFGAQPGITDAPIELYHEAARRLLGELERGHEWRHAVARLLTHLGNDLDRVEGLLAAMLGRRDQWLRLVADETDLRLTRPQLEAGLRRQLCLGLDRVVDRVPGACVAELAILARYAATNLDAGGQGDHPVAALRGLRGLPEADPEGLLLWQGLCGLLMTKDGVWRKRVDRNTGFVAPKDAADPGLAKDMKARMTALIEELTAVPGLGDALAAVPALPPAGYTDAQWSLIEALLTLLKLAAGHLQLVFGERGEVDFIEMTLRAQRALGSPEAPTDLALALDHRIRHLLVDEFQDTSLTQFRLLEQLVAGWEPDDGRTLFLVGDPMQSIYRFRQAEVGLFLQAAAQGLGGVSLGFCRLTANFRSQAGVIDWVNRVFPDLMPGPDEENAAAGAVAYAPAEPQQPALLDDAVQLHVFDARDPDAEAGRMTEIIRAARLADSALRIAVLVRGRTHVARLMPRLAAAGLRAQAVELDALADRPVVRDLQALTRALLHPADRLSWLSVLRAPWCGLSLTDLLTLTPGDDDASVPARLLDADARATLPPASQMRADRVAAVLTDALAERGRRGLRRWVEGTWLALGGPAAAADHAALDAAGAYFDLLDDLDEGGDIADFARLADRVDRLFAPPDPAADPNLQVMTLHKAKGLEFDLVLVPGLGRRTGQDDPALLAWTELPGDPLDGEGRSELLLAPIAGVDQRRDPIADFLRGLDKEKARLEETRLLYVAATRARQRLHLLGHVNGEAGKPASGSLLARLWPALADRVAAIVEPGAVATDRERAVPPPRRLVADWQVPDPPAGLTVGAVPVPDRAAAGGVVAFDWAGQEARHVGTIVHRWLQRIAQTGLGNWDRSRLDSERPAMAAALAETGIARDRVGKLAERVHAALAATLTDECGRWVLSDHDQARCEYALSGFVDERLVHAVIDRCFVADGVRWIVDYKTGAHEGGDTEAFLDREQQRYRRQLEDYARLFAAVEDRPIRLGLYYPMLGGWRAFSPNPDAGPAAPETAAPD